MAAAKFRIHTEEDVLQDLLYLAQHAPILPQIAKKAGEVPKGASFAAISQHVAESLQKKDVDVERILGTFQNLLRAQARMHSGPAQVVGTLLEQFEQYAKSQEEGPAVGDLAKFKEAILQALNLIGSDHPLEMARKTERLFYSHQNTMADVRVLTDFRPVFDQAGEKIQLGVVTQTLFLDYYEGGLPRRLEIGIDASDLENLRAACERAQRKAVALREELQEKGLPTKIGPEDS